MSRLDQRDRQGWDGAGAPGGASSRPEPGAGSAGPGAAQRRRLVMIEAQIRSGEWTDPERGKARLGNCGSAWITERPGLRPRTMDLYRWLLRKHIEPYLGGVPVGKLSTRQIREWRATLLAKGVS